MTSEPKEHEKPFYRSLYSRFTKKPDKEKLKQEISSYLEKPIHTFTLYPFYLWIAGVFLFIFSLIMTFFIYDTNLKEGYFPVIVNVLIYYVSFYALYIGRIERLTINRKKGKLVLSKTNIFLSKVERLYTFDQVDYIEIVIKGQKKGAYDNRKYFVRMLMKEKLPPIEFGYTWSFDKIKFKYQICLAMIKGLVINTVKDYYIKDESVYDDYVY